MALYAEGKQAFDREQGTSGTAPLDMAFEFSRIPHRFLEGEGATGVKAGRDKGLR